MTPAEITRHKFNALRDKHRQGTATLEEKEAYYRLLSSHSYDFDKDDVWAAEWNAHDEVVLSADDRARGERIFDRLMSHISQEEEVSYAPVAVQRPSRFSAVWLGVVCMVFFGIGFYDQRPGISTHEPVSLGIATWCGAMPEPGRTWKKEMSWVRAVKQTRVNLPDGTTVLLNAGSEMSYESDFSSGAREVTLSCEAVFDVHDDPSTPLRVRAKNMMATASGATFDVRTWGDEIVITAVGGHVPVGDGTRVFGEVSADHQMVVNTVSLGYRLRKVGPDEKMFWENEFLILGEVPFGEAMRRISRRFNVGIDVINPALEDCIIHIGILPHEDMQPIVAVLCKTVNARVVKQGDDIRITGGSCR